MHTRLMFGKSSKVALYKYSGDINNILTFLSLIRGKIIFLCSGFKELLKQAPVRHLGSLFN